jgi:hypothetical protein
MSVEELKERKK